MAEDVPVSPPPPAPALIPFLPDEISILCIARVPVTSHTAIAQVSRSWRSAVRSPSFFSLRSELAVTEFVLTVCLFDYSERRHRWYHLHPYQTPFPLPPRTEEQQEKYAEAFSCASLGPHLFCIGGGSSQNSLQIYDGCLRRWSHGPPTSKPREFAVAGLAGGRVHVIDRQDVLPPAPLAESLDPTGTRWDPVPPVPAHLVGDWLCRTDVLDGKLLINWKVGGQLIGAAFDPDVAEWAHAPPWWMYDVRAGWKSWKVVVGGVPYALRENDTKEIVGYGNDGRWKPVEGESVTELLNRMIIWVTLINFGGLLCLVGEEMETRDGFIVRIFAGIDISRTTDGGFRGSIMWLDSSLKHSLKECLVQCVVLEL